MVLCSFGNVTLRYQSKLVGLKFYMMVYECLAIFLVLDAHRSL